MIGHQKKPQYIVPGKRVDTRYSIIQEVDGIGIHVIIYYKQKELNV